MTVDRTGLPGLGAEPIFRAPEFREVTASIGTRILTAAHHRAPVLTLRLLVPVGSSDDPPGQAGLAGLTGDLLDDGTRNLDDVELHESLMRIGGHLAIAVSSDATVVSLTTLPRHIHKAVSLLLEVVARPRFDQNEVRRVRDLRLTRLSQMRHVPSAEADRVFLETVYGRHPYGHLTVGTPSTLPKIEPEDVSAFHRRWYGPSNWTLVAVGAAPEGDMRAAIEDALDGVSDVAPDGADASIVRVPEPTPPGQRLVVVKRADAVQSEIRLGHAGVARRSPDYHALLVLNMVLGGQFISRVNLNLREDKGYTYGARTGFDTRVGRGPFSLGASVQREATADAIREAHREISEIRGERPVTTAELETARAALTRGYPRNFETATQLARAGTTLALHGLPLDEPSRFVSRVASVGAADVTRVAEAHLCPDRLVAVVVGPPDEVDSRLDPLGFGPPSFLD